MEHNVSEKLHRINNLLAETDAVYHQASLRLGIADSTMRILYTILDNGERCLLSDVTAPCAGQSTSWSPSTSLAATITCTGALSGTSKRPRK